MKWDLIIFDCDGVLVDSEAIGNRFIAEALTALGIETSTDEALGEFLGGKLTQIKISVEKKLRVPASRFFVCERLDPWAQSMVW